MSKYQPFLAIILLGGILETLSCSQTFNPEPDFTTQRDLKYFGFALVDSGHDDPNDRESKTNYIDEVSAFCNVAHMAVFQENDDLSDRLSLFLSEDVKAILSIENLFFETVRDSATGSGFRLILRSDYEAAWNSFIVRNSAYISPDYIAALYLVDEPVWNGVSSSDLNAVANTVESDFGHIPLMVIEAYPVIDDLILPEAVDWYGFDRYDTLDPTTDSDYLDDLGRIKNIQSAENQHLVIIMDTQWRPYYQTEGGLSESDMSAIAVNYYRLAQSETNVIALLGYLWPGGLDEPAQKGARNLPQSVYETYIGIGKAITGK